MQKSDFHNLTRANYGTKFNRKNRDRSGGHYSISSNHNSHRWWKRHDSKLARRQQQSILDESKLAYEQGESTPCIYCGELCSITDCSYDVFQEDPFFLDYMDEDWEYDPYEIDYDLDY